MIFGLRNCPTSYNFEDTLQGEIEEKRKLAIGYKVIKQMAVLYFLPARKAG